MNIARPGNASREAHRWRRDALGVVVMTTAVAGVCIFTNLTETLFHASRQVEFLQLDELPIVLLVFACCLIWFAWRRRVEVGVELVRRDAAERKLEELLIENRRLGQQYVDAQESERKRVARELHDDAGQYLNAIKTHAVTLHDQAETSESIRRSASSVIELTDRAYDAVRSLIGQLRPVGLDELGVSAALEHLIETWRRGVPHVEMKLDVDVELDSLTESLGLTVFRIVQEGLTNIGKHAQASAVEIGIRRSTSSDGVDAFEIRVRDNGRGADLSAKTPGFGLIGMRERCEMLDGVLRVMSSPSRGFEVVAQLPIAGAAK